MQFANVRFFERVCRFHHSAIKGPFSGPENIDGFIFVELPQCADARNELFGFCGSDRSISVRVFLIEDKSSSCLVAVQPPVSLIRDQLTLVFWFLVFQGHRMEDAFGVMRGSLESRSLRQFRERAGSRNACVNEFASHASRNFPKGK